MPIDDMGKQCRYRIVNSSITGMARLNGYLFRIMPPRQINVHVEKQERPWSTSSFDVGRGMHTGRKCCNVPTLIEAIYLSSWAENRPLMVKNWTPNLEAVRTSIRFAIATGRLDAT
jgi:hypothetical protein